MDPGHRLALRERLLVIVPIAVFVAATTHWMSWEEPIRGKFAGDVDDYEKISRAAPHFTWPQIEGHISMWPVHYLIGIVAKATHVPLHVVYYVFAFAVLTAIVVVVDRLLGELRVGFPVYAVCMGALLLDPYVFRYLALAPGMINDTVFIASVSFAVLALVRRRPGWVIGALTVAALARSVSVPPALVGAAAWILVGPWSLPRLSRSRVVQAAGTLVVPTIAFAIAFWIGSKTPGHAPALKNCCGIFDTTILGDLRDLPGSAGRFGTHLARIAVGLAMFFALLVAGAVLLRRGRRTLPAVAWASFGVAALMIAQPLLVASTWNAGAEPRLTALAVGPMLAGVALLLTTLGLRLERADVAALLVLFAIGSFSHRFSRPGPHTPAQFAALVLLCAATVAVWVLARNGVLRREAWTPAPLPDARGR